MLTWALPLYSLTIIHTNTGAGRRRTENNQTLSGTHVRYCLTLNRIKSLLSRLLWHYWEKFHPLHYQNTATCLLPLPPLCRVWGVSSEGWQKWLHLLLDFTGNNEEDKRFRWWRWWCFVFVEWSSSWWGCCTLEPCSASWLFEWQFGTDPVNTHRHWVESWALGRSWDLKNTSIIQNSLYNNVYITSQFQHNSSRDTFLFIFFYSGFQS